MKPFLIKSDKQYELVLAYIADLMNADPGSPEEEELELLSVLVELYENKKYPITKNTKEKRPVKIVIYSSRVHLRNEVLITTLKNEKKLVDIYFKNGGRLLDEYNRRTTYGVVELEVNHIIGINNDKCFA